MSTPKYDYLTLEDEFVRGTMSIRELGRAHNIPASKVSSLHVQAKKRKWFEKRAALQNRSTDKIIEILADREAKRRLREAEVIDHAVDYIDELISKAREDLKATTTVTRDGEEVEEPLMRVHPKELGYILDRLAVIFGRPALITENRNANLNLSADVDTSHPAIARLRGLAERVGGGAGQPASGPAGGNSLPTARDNRPN